MPNAHNLTGYGPTQLWVLRTSRYVVFGQGTGGQRTLHKSTPVPQGATAPQFVPRLQYMLQNPFELILKCQEILAVSSARRGGEIPVGRA
eukprot:jgi/Botrbrau1/2484/Bobra.0226s0041.1